MTAFFKYIVLCCAIFAGLQSCQQANRLPNMRETYQYEDAKPFGGEAAYTLLKDIYPDKFVTINKRSFTNFRSETYADSASFYISISKYFYATTSDGEALLDFVKEGNTAFIASSYIDTVFLNKVDCKQGHSQWSFAITEAIYSNGKTSLNDTFNYFYHSFFNHFSKIDSLTGRVLGRNESGDPNFIILFLGKGRLYLHCDPRAFSNYFLLTRNNYNYMKQALQFTRERPGNIFWDDFYNKKNYPERNEKDGSVLAILLKYPPLAAAFWLLVILLLLYIFFNGKRKQRIMPVIKPVENTSVAFTQAIAGLYMAEKNNKTIADKMITYFNDHIRNKYFLSSHGSGKDFVQSLSKKSGVSFESVQALYNTIEQVQLAAEVSDFELLTLNEQIQQFYKNRN